MSRIDASASDKRSRETPHARGEDALIAEASVLSALFVAKRVSAMSPPGYRHKKTRRSGFDVINVLFMKAHWRGL